MDRPLDARTTGNRLGGPSFSLRNRLVRALWKLTWLVLASWTPAPLHAWRATVVRCFGARVGRNFRIHGSARIWLPSNLQAGHNVLIGPEADVYNQGRVTLGDETIISQKAYLCASTHDVDDPHFQLVLRPIAIGRHCWVAADAFVGPGVSMGDRSVLGARAALFGNAEADGIYGGNPAQLLRRRKMREAIGSGAKAKVD